MAIMRKGLQMLLAAVFLLSGTNKLTDLLHKETHQFLLSEGVKWGKVWKPHFESAFAQASLDKATSAKVFNVLLDDGSKTYKVFVRNIGILELVCAATLVIDIASSLGAFVLALVMAGAAWTHVALEDEKAAVPGVLCAFCILILLLPSGSAKSKNAKKD